MMQTSFAYDTTFTMPHKKKFTFTRIKRGRDGDGKGGCGYGRGGWLGRVVDLEVNAPKSSKDAEAQNKTNMGNVSSVKEEFQEKDNSFMDSCLQDSSLRTMMPATHECISPFTVIKSEEEEIAADENVLENVPDFLPIIPEVQSKLVCRLPPFWMPIFDRMGVSVLLLSRDVESTTQRRVFVSFFGNVSVSAHRKKISEGILKSVISHTINVHLTDGTVDSFVHHVISVVNEVRKLEICVGCNNEEQESLWQGNRLGTVDMNPYGETRYVKTYRSHDCQLLIPSSKWRCIKCYHLSEVLKKKFKAHSSGIKSHTPNVHLSETEKIQKLFTIQKKLEVSRRLVAKLRKQMANICQSKAYSSMHFCQDLIGKDRT